MHLNFLLASDTQRVPSWSLSTTLVHSPRSLPRHGSTVGVAAWVEDPFSHSTVSLHKANTKKPLLGKGFLP